MRATGILIILVILLTALVAGGAVFWFVSNRPVPNDVQVTVESIERIAKLATVDYRISTILKKTKAKQGLEWLDAEMAVLIKGHVIGSVDLKKAKIDITDTDKVRSVSIIFKSDAVNISDPVIGEEGIEFYKLKDPNLFHPINSEDQSKAQSEAIAALKQSALDDGIMEQTAAEAKILLTGFLNGLGYSSTIEFEAPVK